MNSHDKIAQYFEAEERGDVESVVAMCSEDVVVHNAANPPQFGKEGARAYVSGFRDRTSRRHFDVLAVAEQADVAYERWKATLTFRAGVIFGPVTTLRPFDLELEGICRFKLDPSGLFREIDVFHETTTALSLAQEAAKDN